MGAAADNFVRTARHTTHYLAAGPQDGTPVIFVHGWPELSRSWRHQLPVVGGLGFRAIAPDMRGYGQSSLHPRHEDYGLESIVADMVELLDHLGAEKAIWVGHDWGSPVVWSMAQHHPGRCHGVANMCVPYNPDAFAAENTVKLVDRTLYPEDQYPAGQWDYQYFYRERFDAARRGFEGNVRATVKALFRKGSPKFRGSVSHAASVRARDGWFGPDGTPARDRPRDEDVITQEDEDAYVTALSANGFFGPGSWYMNAPANIAFAERARDRWRLDMPVLFLHALYDDICATVDGSLADPMRGHCPRLTEHIVASGHWMAQERPAEVNAFLTRWLAAEFPQVWPKDAQP